jgi:MEMO1 family protein
MNATVREPAVAGQFYPGRRETLLRDIESYTRDRGDPIKAIGCIVPHAGYMYSGHVAGAVYGRLQLPRRYVILCPNHTGMGKPLAVISKGLWRTPLGEVPIDAELALRLKSTCPLLTEDAAAHASEHALEVQLPFLQALRGEFRFVPITVGTGNYDALCSVGEAIADSASASGEPILVVASSDMNHYEDDALTRVKDRKAIDRILALDPAGLYETVRREHVSMCGYGPAVVMLTAAKRLGAASADLIKYATSGDISGDRDAVVGYAGIAVK